MRANVPTAGAVISAASMLKKNEAEDTHRESEIADCSVFGK